MTMFRCFSIPSERKGKNKGNEKSSKENFNAALAKLQNSRVSSGVRESVPITFDVRVPHHGVQKSSRFNVRVINLESPVKAEVEEAYEGEDESDDSPLIKRELSDFDLQIHEAAAGKDGHALTDEKMNEGTDELEDRIDRYSQKSADNQTGHVSDPGIGKSDFLTESSESIDLQSFDRIIDGDDDQMRGRFQNEDSGFCPQNQCFALSTESSSLAWVDAWVKDLKIEEPLPEDNFDDDNDNDRSIAFPPSPDAGKTMKRSASQLSFPDANPSKEILNANNVVQSLNPASHLSNLRAVNLSNSFIDSIVPGCLPKSIQTLDLSRNKISTVEGLRELTRLRVLDLSYNRISRIGQGLSGCTLIRELYITGNKISDVEGLHRLFKLTVLDLSFNKITTTKALGQLVANYNSIQALNLLGNPIQRNISDEQLKKAVCGLLPKLTYLNKQPLKAQRPRDILTDSVAKAALGNIKQSSGRRALKRVGQGGSSSRGYRSSAGVSQKSRSRIRR